jgi:hypothetical protein
MGRCFLFGEPTRRSADLELDLAPPQPLGNWLQEALCRPVPARAANARRK